MTQDWNTKNVFSKWLERNYSPQEHEQEISCSKPIYFYEENESIPLSELESVVSKSATLVNELGSEYLDLFERAEEELKKAKQDLNTLERIRSLTVNPPVQTLTGSVN